MPGVEPAYRRLLCEGGFPERVRLAQAALADCTLCAQECHVDRTRQVGFCRTGTQAPVSSAFPHRGEEDPLRGWPGCGWITAGSLCGDKMLRE
jgi:putative pyruvate formate lyase activating enzyme